MEDTLVCTACDLIFEVVWNNDGLGPPEYCPMCGSEIDYQRAWRIMNDDM